MGRAKFIRRVIIFSALFTGLLTSLILIVGYLLGSASFRLPEGRRTLILGDSQMEYALNDSILTGAVNLAQGGEAYLYAYGKARRFIAEDPDLDTIWVSYNLNSLERRQRILTRSTRYSRYKIPYNFFLFGMKEASLFIDQGSAYETIARTPWLRRNYVKKLLKRKTTFRDLSFGGYTHSDRNKLAVDVAYKDSLLKAGAVPDPGFGDAPDQVEYLLRLVDLCHEKGIVCILVNTPVHPIIKAHADTAAYYRFWRERMPNVPLWDHASWAIPDSCYGDATHLNQHGARLYSGYLNTLRSQGWQSVTQRNLDLSTAVRH